MCWSSLKALEAKTFISIALLFNIACFIQTTAKNTKYIQFSVINNKEKNETLTFEKLEAENVWHFLLSKWVKQ